ncbi:hypothetical protein OF117_00950 [Geodermatophilus sp. YIM 151500]|uniref:hypothetical protein n=1 Tax=Geodermatophilus sp. YIM 151500 TaxID=2984531 RepID=UPI0021E516F4|nr:hypothetical protein [Geodermatophilus sp. YIM 151500]MCV2487915.1 hypothetical protein [Geodermatophilus sp. YIM 151500]
MNDATHLHRSGARRPGIRRAAAAAAVVVGLGGLTGCADAAGSGADAVSSEDVERLEADLGSLDDRLGELEQDLRSAAGDAVDRAGAAASSAAADLGVLEDVRSLLDREITFTAEVGELLQTTDAGTVFRVEGPGGEPVTVVAPDAPAELTANDVVEVSGTVRQIGEDTFQQDFGVTADQLLQDPQAFFQDARDQFAVDADTVRVVQDATGGN